MKKQFVSPSIKVIKAETSVICASETEGATIKQLTVANDGNSILW